jgi:2,3-bisphosphoglycerate-independent phosphoglycerate mutase
MDINAEKYVLYVIDGAADRPLEALHGKTALEAARHPAMDRLAAEGALDLARTIRKGFPSGTDTALLALFGYRGGPGWSRGALEAAGLNLDTAGYANILRCNLVSLSQDSKLLSHNGFDIGDQICAELTETLREDSAFVSLLRELDAVLLPGKGFRCLIATNDAWQGFPGPHDHLNEPMPEAPPVWGALLRRAEALLQDASSSVHLERTVNGIWPWGGGPAPVLRQFAGRFGLAGDCVCAVPVVKGIARLAGLDVVDLPGATGRLDTNWGAKAKAAAESVRPFTLLHLEAPDECSHEKDPFGKVKSIEMADRMLAALIKDLEIQYKRYRLLVMADHCTSAESGRHLPDPVPYILYDSVMCKHTAARRFTEPEAKFADVVTDAGHLLDMLLKPSKTG